MIEIFQKYSNGGKEVPFSKLKDMLKDAGYDDFTERQYNLIEKFSNPTQKETITEEEFLDVVLIVVGTDRTFVGFDIDGSGTIKYSELTYCLGRMDYAFSWEQTENMFKIVDEDGSGDFDKAEFRVLSYFLKYAKVEFALLDKDKSGDISFSELKELLPKMGIEKSEKTDKQAQDLLQKYDTDKSGKLEFEEFVALLFDIIEDPRIRLEEEKKTKNLKKPED